MVATIHVRSGRRRTAWRTCRAAPMAAAALALTGCYLELAASYYPRVDGGDRTGDTGWGIAINTGFRNPELLRTRVGYARGVELVNTRYQDRSGSGRVSHIALETARLDVEVLDFPGRWSTDVSVGGAFSAGRAQVVYDEAMVQVPSAAKGPNIASTVQALWAGPTMHFDDGANVVDFTLAAAHFADASQAYDPFSATGVTFRFAYQPGAAAKPMESLFGWTKLFKARKPEEYDEELRRMREENERAGDALRQRERDRQESERRDRERERQQQRPMCGVNPC